MLLFYFLASPFNWNTLRLTHTINYLTSFVLKDSKTDVAIN